MIDGKQVQTLRIATSKCGKHGSAKTCIEYIDPVTGHKKEIVLSAREVEITTITRQENTLDDLILG